MKKFLAWFMVWGLLLACALDAQAMEQASAAPKHNVQHMQIMTKSSEGIIIADTWQDIQQKHTRIDIVEYVLADEAVKAVNQHRSVVLYRNEKMFEVSRSQGKEEEFNRDILDPNTGLPIKEEYYFGQCSTPTITKMYVFEEIDDPEGVLQSRHKSARWTVAARV